MELDFKVLTLNCWGLLAVSKHRSQRIQAIAEFLANCQYDVVCLQEVWMDKDYQLIKEKVLGSLPFSHYFYSGVTGSGVCILSKHPIEETFFHQWSVNGYIHKLHHGDWFGGKGVGLCRLKVNDFQVNVYSAHLHAEYNRARDEYQAHRVLQAYDTAQFILLTSQSSDLVVLAGDLNTEPGDLAYRVMLNVPGLKDAFSHAGDIKQDMIATNESLRNSYTPSSLVKRNISGKRIDYIMFHSGSNTKVDLKQYSLPMPDRVPHQSFSYSDHEAIAVNLVLKRASENDECDNSSFNLRHKRSVLEESIDLCDEALKSISRSKIVYWLLTFIFFMCLLVILIAPPVFNSQIVYYIIKAFVTIFMVFTLLMATLWNKIEMHAVLAGKLAMEMTLRRFRVGESL